MREPEHSLHNRLIVIIEDQPEDSSLDDILRELAFYRLVERGLTDAEEDDTVDHAGLRRHIASWKT